MTISKDAADTSLLSQVLSMLFGSSSQTPSSDQGIPTTISDQGIGTAMEVGANLFNHAYPSVHHHVIPVMRINQS